MAFDAKPSTWLGAGYTVDAGNHLIKLTTAEAVVKAVPELTDAEANPTTGDIRKVIFALLEAIYQAQLAQLVADRPAQVVVYRSSQTDETTGIVTRTYTVVTKLAIGTIDVAAEPA